MIDVKISNLKLLEKVERKINEKAEKNIAKAGQYAFALKAALERNMIAELGKDAKHFTVDISSVGTGFKVIIKSVDQAGKYLFSGTSSHSIESTNNPMPIGGGKFSYKVHHPGTKGISDKIYAIILKSELEARQLAGIGRDR